MSEFVKITEDEFWANFKPKENHLVEDAGWDGCLYETYGEELKYVHELALKENRVWTIIESDEEVYEDYDCSEHDNGEDEPYVPSIFYIVSGFHYVNRIGFLVTEIPYEKDTEIKID